MSHGFNDDGLGAAMALSGQNDSIEALRKRVDFLEREMQRIILRHDALVRAFNRHLDNRGNP